MKSVARLRLTTRKRPPVSVPDKENIDPTLPKLAQKPSASTLAWPTPAYTIWPTSAVPAGYQTPLVYLAYAYPVQQPRPQSQTVFPVFGNIAENATEKQQTEGDEKYKTEMCKNWVLYGRCSYGSKCRFAHGKDDMVNKQVYNPKYKSKKCEGFHTQFYCPYGSRCNFIHDEDTAYKSRALYYTYLLDPQIKFVIFKQRLLAYIDSLLAGRTHVENSVPAQRKRANVLLATVISYIRSSRAFARLSVFLRLGTVSDESLDSANEPKRERFVDGRRRAAMEELFAKFSGDYAAHRHEREYWAALGTFVNVLIALHPALKDCYDFVGLQTGGDVYKRLLARMHSALLVESSEEMTEECRCEGRDWGWDREEAETEPEEEESSEERFDPFSVKW